MFRYLEAFQLEVGNDAPAHASIFGKLSLAPAKQCAGGSTLGWGHRRGLSHQPVRRHQTIWRTLTDQSIGVPPPSTKRQCRSQATRSPRPTPEARASLYLTAHPAACYAALIWGSGAIMSSQRVSRGRMTSDSDDLGEALRE